MFRTIMKKIRKMAGQAQTRQVKQQQKQDSGSPPLDKSLQANLAALKKTFQGCAEVVYREFDIGQQEIRGSVIYLEGAIYRPGLHDYVMESLMLESRQLEPNAGLAGEELFKTIRDKALTIGHVDEIREMGKAVETILDGEVVLLIEGYNKGLVLTLVGGEYRSVEEPPAEAVVRGPREGFTENLSTNIILVRRRLKTPDFYTERLKVGRKTKTAVVIGYLKGTADDNVVAEVRKRIKAIDVDGILESGELEELIEDNPFSPFPTINHTERPDKVAGLLLGGRVAVFVDNTPFVLTVPHLFVELLQAAEDYYDRWIISSIVRVIRYIALNIAVFFPSLYIAVTTFHQEMLPTPLLLNIAGAREGVPFPGFVEALIMELAFELLREAGVRLPRPVGQAVSIVGALVIGQASVTAGLASPAMVIVVALTGIASFAISGYGAATTMRILRFPLMAMAASLGLFGIMMGGIVIVIHAVSLRSFGVPYLSPVAPFTLKDWRDVLIRGPMWIMNSRPRVIGYRNPIRQAPSQKPRPPEPVPDNRGTKRKRSGGQ